MADPLLDVLGGALDGPAVRSLARGVGVDVDVARRALDATLPILIERLQRNAQQDDGAEAIARAVREDHDAELLGRAADFLGGRFRGGPGVAILTHVFGDELAGVTAELSRRTGIPASVVSLVLTAVAPLVLSAITKAAVGAVTAAAVAGLLELAADQVRQGRVREVLDGATARLDGDGDGSAVDDVGRGVAAVATRTGRRVLSGARTVATDERVRRVGRASARQGARAATVGAREGTRLARRAALQARDAVSGWLRRR